MELTNQWALQKRDVAHKARKLDDAECFIKQLCRKYTAHRDSKLSNNPLRNGGNFFQLLLAYSINLFLRSNLEAVPMINTIIRSFPIFSPNLIDTGTYYQHFL